MVYPLHHSEHAYGWTFWIHLETLLLSVNCLATRLPMNKQERLQDPSGMLRMLASD
jgi:hypothetical protein